MTLKAGNKNADPDYDAALSNEKWRGPIATRGRVSGAARDWRSAALPPVRMPLLLVLFALALFLVPVEASLFLGPLRLPLERAILLLATPYVVFRFGRHAAAPEYCFVWSDVFVPLLGGWMILADWSTEGPDRALVGASATALEIVGAYFLARSLLRLHGQAIRFAQILSLLIAVVGCAAILDTLSSSYALHDFFGRLTGLRFEYILDVRHGMLRAASVFEHPILLGTTACFGLLLAVTTLSGSRRVLAIGGTALALLLAVSSGPIASTLIGLLFLAYRRFTSGFDGRWHALQLALALALTAIFTILPAPFGWLIGHTAFDPSSGYYRLLIWQVAGDDVLRSPIVGLGLSDAWARPSWMPATVDSVWLRTALSFGIPGSVLLALSIFGACSRRVDTWRAHLLPEERRLGATLSLILFLYVLEGFSVHFWGITWTLLGLVMGMRAHLGALGATVQKSPASLPAKGLSFAQPHNHPRSVCRPGASPGFIV